MDKVYIVFWTQGGNTGAMASAIGDGVTAAGKEPVFLSPSEADINELKDLPGFAMGCPAMGAEVLEETEMEPLLQKWKASQPESRSRCSVLMAGAMASGCVTGLTV